MIEGDYEISGLFVSTTTQNMREMLSASCVDRTCRKAVVAHTRSWPYRLTVDVYLQIQVMEVVPLCSAQYERLFNTCRIPGVEVGE